MSITDNDMIALAQDLRAKLPELKKTSNVFLEYGEKLKPGGTFSRLRIRYMNTAGGPQYSLKMLTHLGGEGSGFYDTDEMAIITMAMKYIADYHRPNPGSLADKFSKQVKEKTEKLDIGWHFHIEGAERPSRHPPLPSTIFPGEVIINLEQDMKS